MSEVEPDEPLIVIVSEDDGEIDLTQETRITHERRREETASAVLRKRNHRL